MHRIAAAGLLSLLAACNGASAPSTTEDPPPVASAEARALAAQGCSWVKVFDPTVVNLALPDTSAHYWITVVPSPGPLGRIRLHGRVPDARHFSLNSYDALTSPYDALADYQIAPSPPGRTPFLGPAEVDRSIAPGAEYSIDLSFDTLPESRAPNTIYSGRLANIAGIDLPNPLAAVLIYRSYLPEGDDTGGAGLPEILLETADGAQVAVGGGDACSDLLHRALAQAGLDFLSALLVDTGLPPLPIPLPLGLGAKSPPEFSVSYGTTAILTDRLPLLDFLSAGSGFAGFFSTKNNRYVSTMISHGLGSVVIVRGRAPRHVGGDGEPQLRYWSVCQNEFLTQRVVACVPDEQAVLDEEGYYHIVISDPEARPAAAEPARGYNWLPWGFYYDGMVIVRNLLPAPDFAEAFHNIPRGTDPVSVSGEYFPQGSYCRKAVFDAAAEAGAAPRAVFEACRGAQRRAGR